MTITSKDNPALKEIRKLRSASSRARSGLFIAEGEDLLAAADAAGWKARRRLAATGSGLQGDPVLPELLDDVSTLGSGTRTIAVYEALFQDLPTSGVRVHLHGLRDPGNVGTILRSAHALGASGVSIGPGTADPFGPKAVRASMGAVFALPIGRSDDPAAGSSMTVALVCEGGVPPSGPLPEESVLIVGSERDGLPAAMAELADVRWTIPIAAQAESLNAAAALAIALSHANKIGSP